MADLFRGCLPAGAIGDALGAPVEFWSLSEIRSRLGDLGVTGYLGGGAVTDDTQMALFTGEGLIRASVQQRTGARPIASRPIAAT
jgi:ADP-ribosylglycohydrolase